MLFSVITPNYNGGRFLEEALRSVFMQSHEDGIEIEYIIIDGKSTDCSGKIIEKYAGKFSEIIIERDSGPANAINKGLRIANGDVVSWLNADDRYLPGAFGRVRNALQQNPKKALCFGRCPIIDERGVRIRSFITRFKEAFFPFSSLFAIQCINFVSQPAMFFRRTCLEKVGFLREDLVAAWDYDFLLRLWHRGGAVAIKGLPVAEFRWHAGSISGQSFVRQFKEEFEIAVTDAGAASLQTMIHWCVRWGIVGIYSAMRNRRVVNNG